MHHHSLAEALKGIAVWAIFMKLAFYRKRRVRPLPIPRKPVEVNLREAKRWGFALRRASRWF